MTAVQAELRRFVGDAPQTIAQHFFDTYGIVAQLHLDGKLWLLDYDQLAAHKHRMSEAVMESRGLILNATTGDIVRRPFARFFNIGEAPAYEADIDYARLKGLEKADGSLVTFYFNDVTGHWQIGTRGTPFADGWNRVQCCKFYERVLLALGFDFEPGSTSFDSRLDVMFDRKVTYMFEFIGPDNLHVTPYAKSELVLLGARNRLGVEFTPDEVQDLFDGLTATGWPVRLPATYPIPLKLEGMSRSQQVEAIKAWVASAPEFKGLHEGLVCYDPVTGKRLKVKTPLYCAVHLQTEDASDLTISAARVADLIVSGDAEEFCLYFPALAPKVQAMASKVQDFIAGLAPIWDEVKDIEDQKAFALAVNTKAPAAGTGIFFQARKDKVSPALAWVSMPLNRKASLAEKLVK